MPKYFYLASSLKGEEKKGVLEAKDIHHLSQILKRKGYILIKAEIFKKRKKIEFSLPFFNRVSSTEKLIFIRNLKVMISAGLPLPKALEVLAKQAKSKKFKKVLSKIREEVVKGKDFSQALKDYPQVFSELFQNMVKVGEESGTLDKVLGILAEQMERKHQLSSKIKGAMMYPMVVILAMIGIGTMMLIMVVPKLAETFQELNVELPMTTKIVIGFGNFLTSKWYLLLIIIFSLFLFFWQALKIRKMKKLIDALNLRIPIISPIVRKTNSAYMARTLGSLMSAGLPIVRSLEITSGTLGNHYFKESLIEASKVVSKGEKLSTALLPYQNLYPPMVIQMINVGEQTGETAKILEKLAEYFEDEVSNATKNLASIIEPIIMLIIGGAVGFFAVSMIQPIYSMMGAL